MRNFKFRCLLVRLCQKPTLHLLKGMESRGCVRVRGPRSLSVHEKAHEQDKQTYIGTESATHPMGLFFHVCVCMRARTCARVHVNEQNKKGHERKFKRQSLEHEKAGDTSSCSCFIVQGFVYGKCPTPLQRRNLFMGS